MSGIRLPKGLAEAARLAQPVFTSCIKTTSGERGAEITFSEMAARIGMKRAKKMREVSIAVYLRARDLAQARGIIIAETKLQFGFADDETILIDELLTADSTRFWLAEDYQLGSTPESCDTHYLRDYLRSMNWDRRPPVPTLPPEIIGKMQGKYQEVLRRLTASPTACLDFEESKMMGLIPGPAKPAIANQATQIPRQF
jgi:phosphoribosylaminoimidazole-succinocarboxamide synthase